MSLKVDRLQLEIIINNDSARKSLRALDDEARTIQKSMKGMKEGTDEWVQSTKRLSSIKTQMDAIQDSIGITGLTLNELRKKQQEFNMIVKNLPGNSPEYAKYKSTLDEINGRITELSGKSKEAKGIIRDMFGVAGGIGIYEMASEGIKKITEAVKEYVSEGIKSAIEMRDSEKLLLSELNGQKDVQQDLINLAKQKANTTFFSRLEIEESEKFLAIQERTPEQIRKTIEAATNLATLTGGSLQDAVEQLDGTMEGKLSKGLGKLSKDFKDLSKEQLYSGAAIDLIQKKYAGLAEKDMNTMDGMINLLTKSWQGLQRTIGEFIIGSGGMFGGIIKDATAMLDTFKSWIEIPVSKKLEEEQNRVNFLAASITDANLTADARNKLYKELETLAPSVTKGLDEENISYQKLTTNLAAYNDQMVNNIIIQKETEKVDNANADLAKARMARVDQENAMRKNMTDLLTSLKTRAKSENAKDAAETLAQAKKLSDVLYNNNLNFRQKMEVLDKQYVGPKNQSYQIALDAENAAQAKVNLQLQAKKQLIADLGISTAAIIPTLLTGTDKGAKAIIDFSKITVDELNKIISAGAVQGASEKEKSDAREAQKELKSRETSLQHLQKFTDDYNRIMQAAHDVEKMNFADKLSQTELEIKNVNDKYNAEIKKLKEFMTARDNLKMLKPAQKQEMSNEIDVLEVEKKKQVNQVLEQAEKDFADKVAAIHENLRVARMTITDREVYEINKKYDELQKEIIDAIQYRYDQEIILANGDLGKVLVAEKNKADAQEKVKDSMAALTVARNEETNKALKTGDEKFNEDLKSLNLKSETDLATGKEKIQLEVNQKYKKLLQENADDLFKWMEIQVQMQEETDAKTLQLTEDNNKKKIESLKNLASNISTTLSSIFAVQNEYENQGLANDEKSNTQKKDNLKQQLDKKLISQKQYDAGVAKLDLDMENKKKDIAHKQAVRAKEIAVFNATIALLGAIIQAANIAPPADIVMPIIIAALMGVQLAALIATPVPAAATGRYNVIGNQDGKAYNNVPYNKSFTGIPGRPMLVNETGNEIVIDPYTTRNIQMNYPDIIEGINQARVPQRASGSYPDSGSSRSATNQPVIVQFHPDTLKAMNDFQEQIKKPLDANIVYDNLKYSMNTVAQLEKSVTR